MLRRGVEMADDEKWTPAETAFAIAEAMEPGPEPGEMLKLFRSVDYAEKLAGGDPPTPAMRDAYASFKNMMQDHKVSLPKIPRGSWDDPLPSKRWLIPVDYARDFDFYEPRDPALLHRDDFRTPRPTVSWMADRYRYPHPDLGEARDYLTCELPPAVHGGAPVKANPRIELRDFHVSLDVTRIEEAARGVMITLRMDTTERDRPGEPCPLRFAQTYPDVHTKAELLEKVRELLITAVTHEIDEKLFCDGRRVNDPHRKAFRP